MFSEMSKESDSPSLILGCMEQIECTCGCGTLIDALDSRGRAKRYALGHGNRGKKLSAEEIAQRTATRLDRNGGVYQTKSGWKHSEETRAKIAAANRARDMTGENNPFYGQRHTPETMARIAAAISGPLNHGWKGGAGTLPYGPEFTRKFKRMIRARDNQTCQRCGVSRQDYGRTLEVHHIDHDKMNNDPSNLVTTCASCNVWLWWHRGEPFVPPYPQIG